MKRLLKILSALMIGFAVVCFWRGIWGLLDFYLFPSNHLLSYSLSALIGIIILILSRRLVKSLI